MILDIPELLLSPKSIAFNLRGSTISGPPSLAGNRQVVESGAECWAALWNEVPVGDPQRVKLYRALLAELAGGANEVRVPVCDDQQAPWPLDAYGNPITSMVPVTFDDGATFDDGSTFYEPVIVVNASVAAAAGTTLLNVTVTTAGDIVGGEHFSIRDYLYRIRRIVADDGAGNLTLSIAPRLREAVVIGDVCDFDRPVCKMRLSEEGSGELALDFGRYGFPSMAFVESF